MPNYVWKGRNRAGLVQEGVLAADSKDVALASLRRQNIVVTGIRERGKEISLTKVGRKVPPKTLAVFTRQFSVMIVAASPLQCLEILAMQQEQRTSRNPLQCGRLRCRFDVATDAAAPDAFDTSSNDRRRCRRYPRHDLHRLLVYIEKAGSCGRMSRRR